MRFCLVTGDLRPEVVTHIPVPTATSPLLPTEDCDNSSASVGQEGQPQPSTEDHPTTRPPPTAQGQSRGAFVLAITVSTIVFYAL